jgi:hypothetical protein
MVADMWTTVAVHTKGRRLSFQVSRKSSMARLRSGMLAKLPRRTALDAEEGEPTLDQVEPARTGWNEVCHEARMSVESRLDPRVLVGAVVVEHQMQGCRGRKLLVGLAQEAQKLLMPVTLEALADDTAIQYPDICETLH